MDILLKNHIIHKNIINIPILGNNNVNCTSLNNTKSIYSIIDESHVDDTNFNKNNNKNNFIYNNINCTDVNSIKYTIYNKIYPLDIVHPITMDIGNKRIKLGSGSFADVYKIYLEINNDIKEAAIKIPNNSVSKKRAIKYSQREVDILNRFEKSEYLLKLLEYRVDNDNNYIVIELLGNEVNDLLDHYNQRNELMPITNVKHIIRQILHGLNELRTYNILHLDLKLENILFTEKLHRIFKWGFGKFKLNVMEKVITSNILYSDNSDNFDNSDNLDNLDNLDNSDNIDNSYKSDKSDLYKDKYERRKYISSNIRRIIQHNIKNQYNVLRELVVNKMNIKISDFGNAYSNEMRLDKNSTLYRQRPTRSYIAPEILLGIEPWVESDMWSLGCMLYELLTGEVLFYPEKDNNMGINSCHLLRIISIFGKIPPSLIDKGSKKYRYFIDYEHKFNYLLKHTKLDPKNKLSYILYNNGIDVNKNNGLLELLIDILEIDPAKRITPIECLNNIWLSGGNQSSKVERVKDPTVA